MFRRASDAIFGSSSSSSSSSRTAKRKAADGVDDDDVDDDEIHIDGSRCVRRRTATTTTATTTTTRIFRSLSHLAQWRAAPPPPPPPPPLPSQSSWSLNDAGEDLRGLIRDAVVAHCSPAEAANGALVCKGWREALGPRVAACSALISGQRVVDAYGRSYQYNSSYRSACVGIEKALTFLCGEGKEALAPHVHIIMREAFEPSSTPCLCAAIKCIDVLDEHAAPYVARAVSKLREETDSYTEACLREDSTLRFSPGLISAFGAHALPHFGAVVEVLSSPNRHARSAAVDTMAGLCDRWPRVLQLGKDFDDIAALLRHDDPDIRCVALRAIHSTVGVLFQDTFLDVTPDIRAEIISFVNDPVVNPPAMRRHALLALAAIGGDWRWKPLLPLPLVDAITAARAQVVAIVSTFDDTDVEVRSSGYQALAGIGEFVQPQDLKALIDSLESFLLIDADQDDEEETFYLAMMDAVCSLAPHFQKYHLTALLDLMKVMYNHIDQGTQYDECEHQVFDLIQALGGEIMAPCLEHVLTMLVAEQAAHVPELVTDVESSLARILHTMDDFVAPFISKVWWFFHQVDYESLEAANRLLAALIAMQALGEDAVMVGPSNVGSVIAILRDDVIRDKYVKVG